MNRRVLIAGTHSGSGKTTVTCAILSALKARGNSVTAFKCGPDFIDPMFHRSVSGVPSWNLDPFFLDREGLRAHFASHAGNEKNSISVIEGVMGYYDGIAGTSDASAWTVAVATESPVILVVDVSGAGNSIAAVIEGFVRYRENSNIRAVIFNGATENSYPYFAPLAETAGLRSLGYLPRSKEWSVGSRHLGLVTAEEIAGLEEKLAALGRQAEKTVDMEKLIEIAECAPDIPPLSGISPPPPLGGKKPRLAVAKDRAFCFMYPENLELLERCGAELAYFSPLADAELPENIQGIYLPGGYPELHCEELSANKPMLSSIKTAIGSGMPAIAECGGFLYLHETLDGWPMADVFHAAAYRTEKLQRFGYIEIIPERDTLFCEKGGKIKGHEFHYWESAEPGKDFTAKKPGRAEGSPGAEYSCAHATETLYAGFPHLYFPSNPDFAARFVKKMAERLA